MLSKLTFRNAARSVRDYMIYISTMSLICALMYAFHGMMFSDDLKAISNDVQIFAALIGLASFFIMIIVVWLVHYMVHFMMERRSREFGTYMLLGMKKKKVAGVFWKENILLGFVSLLIGILPGFIFQKLFINIFYSVLDSEYRISAEINIWGLFITAGVLLFAYILALIHIKIRFRKLQICDLVYLDKRNEEIVNEKRTWKKIFVPASFLYIVAFHVLVLRGMMTLQTGFFYVFGLIVSIYLLYYGLSSFFVSYIQKKRSGVYREANIFILRQLSSKIKTMRFTMGTLTILFTAALLGWTVVMMFGDYQSREMTRQLPFDALIFSDQSDENFKPYIEVMNENVKVKDTYIYRIYEDQTTALNDYLYQHRNGTYRSEISEGGKTSDSTYFGYDTYMRESDYNKLRTLIGLHPIQVEPGHYILHGKEVIESDLEEISRRVEVKTKREELQCQEIRTEPFSQEGMNGADYILVVPDRITSEMKPYYSLLAADLEGDVPPDLQSKLKALEGYFSEKHLEGLYSIQVGRGSSQVLSWADTVLVSENVIKEGEFIITALCFLLGYLGVVFLCTALTILAVQQLSDSVKYPFRYKIIGQLGVSEAGICKVVFQQMAAFYICPCLVSILLSMFIGMFVGERFVYYTGIHAVSFQYYFFGVLVFVIIYAVYFTISYVGFLRNLFRKS